MRMTVGERVIDAEIMERQKARETYEVAKKAGQTASLLEQQRPNVFQMNVANILPGMRSRRNSATWNSSSRKTRSTSSSIPPWWAPAIPPRPRPAPRIRTNGCRTPICTKARLRLTPSSGRVLKQRAAHHQTGQPQPRSGDQLFRETAARIKIKDEKTAGNKDFVLRYGLAGGKIDGGLLLYPGPERTSSC